MKHVLFILGLLLIVVSLAGIGLKGERYALDGIEFYQRGDYTDAINSFNNADKAASGSVPEYFYWLGRLNIAVADTVNARIWLNRYVGSKDEKYAHEVQNYLEIMDRQFLIFEKTTMREMPSYINSRNSDYGAFVSPDKKYMYFTSLRPSRYDKENIYRSEKLNNIWGKPQLVTELTTDKNEAIGSISLDGKTAYVFGNYERGKIDGDLYTSTYSGKWDSPKPIQALNTPQVELQPMCYEDQLLFFVSSRPDGIGGTDIYVSKKLDGEWQEPINLGPMINTVGNEQTPFLDWDGKTLFFASDSHVGFGGYDIFKAVKIGDNWTDWSIPENLGLPINSIKNDRYYYHIKNTNEAIFSTDRQAEGFENLFSLTLVYSPTEYLIVDETTGDKTTVFDVPVVDTTQVVVPEKPKKSPIRFTGRITDEERNPIVADVIFNYDIEENSYRDVTGTDSNGRFDITLPYADKYVVTVNKDGYFISSKEFYPTDDSTSVEINFELQKMVVKKVFVFNNIQFEFDSAVLLDNSYSALNDIVLSMINNPEIKVEISGHTCNIGTAKYNLNLSERRAKSVVEYLLSKGVEPERLSFKGMGLTSPIADNETPEGQVLNRRVEVKVVE